MPEIIRVLGPPGTGKSTELLRLITKDAEQFGSSRIGAVSFTTSAVHTIADRIVQAGFDVPDNVKTIHAHCYRLLGIKDGEVADTKKHLTEFGSRYPHWKMSDKTESIEDRGMTEEQVTGEAKRLRVNDQLFNNMQVLRNRMTPLDQWPDFEKEIYGDWSEFMQDEGLIDFTGMLEKVLRNELMIYLDSLFVDEAQDLSALSMAILMMWAGNTKRTTLLGDSNQCQPAGTMVSTIDGPVPIESIQKGDRIYSFSRDDQALYQKIEVEDVGSRPYIGMMYKITSNGCSTNATANHKWLVRWDLEKVKEKCCVYLMSRTFNGRVMFRVGWCQVLNVQNLNHLRFRANTEKAENVWILKICDSRQEASMFESYVSTKFSISTVLFEAPDNAIVYTPEFLDFFWKEVMASVPANMDVFLEFHRQYEYPLFRMREEKQKKFTLMEVESCNLFPDFMKVPVPDRRKKIFGIRWENISSISSDFVENQIVYSLDVKKHHTYVADGIITCNSIFRFSGSAPEVFMGLPSNRTTILDQSYRVSPRILDYSQSIIRQVSQREDAEYRPCMDYGPGEVIFGVDEPDLSLPGTHMILGRTHRETEYWIKRLIALGVVWHNPLRREDKRWNPTDTTAWKAYHAFKRLQNGESLYGAEVQELVSSMKARGNLSRGLKARVENWDNMRICRKYSPMDLYSEGFTDRWLDGDVPLTEWLSRESGIAEHVERLYTTEKPTVIVGTCHSSKGGEADHVWVDMRISKTQYNRLMGQHGEQSTWDDECRLAYVAATRAKKTLGLMIPEGQGKIFNKCFSQE